MALRFSNRAAKATCLLQDHGVDWPSLLTQVLALAGGERRPVCRWRRCGAGHPGSPPRGRPARSVRLLRRIAPGEGTAVTYTVEQRAPGSYDALLDGMVITALVRSVHRSGLSDTWQVELLDERPAIKRPAPFTAQRHIFKSRRLRWNGSASERPTPSPSMPNERRQGQVPGDRRGGHARRSWATV